MQTKIFAVAVAALSMASVQGAIAPRATIGPTVIVIPQITINPNELLPTQAIFATLDLLRADIAKTTELVNQLTVSTTNTLFSRISQASAVLAQATANVGTIVAKITELVNILKNPPSTTPTLPGTPGTPSVPALPDIGGVAEDLVRTAQALARAITAQLQVLQQQASGFTGLLLLPTYLAAQAALGTVLATVGTISNLALGTATAVLQTANATAATIDSILARVRNAQVKLNPVLVIGLNPDIVF
ncbi:hypothetical protein CH063_11932 [Colletotrichum higginsianum]|uniref:Cell wall protein n=2 Tax=Colletotrichum higginsianum TaxID=80884 RepID=H1VNE4_COLHI|nr:hypothetical protein CH63R_01918 [Colletotrichum higginsianum IMI 349063]OBR13192.1 hypothetical protein CH63R_01918 [Colletotrichum higginsianum IMI 349063]TID02746.1 hypothetical protein CH35J_003445 [Colletotrichum higginsianum]CCF41748.1 hypothetical protein CH063_11932 [Colletotrichum higginsianum]